MALIEQAKLVCDRLAPLGWRDLLYEVTNGELDISQPNPAALRDALLKPLAVVDRNVEGFSDFSLGGNQGITPRSAASSLLYHALASPCVGRGLDVFPTMTEIDTIENLVFGIEPVSIDALADGVGLGSGDQFSIAVFAYEYRPAKDTCARVQADFALSRCGIARVGTHEPRWDERNRGFQSEVESDPFGFHVCPVRYGAFLSVTTSNNPTGQMRPQPRDDTLIFISPVHKLFPGDDCLAGMDLALKWNGFHYNDKIRRTREKTLGMTTQPNTPPFVLVDLAEIGDGLVTPIPRPRLIEPAMFNGKPLTFGVPQSNSQFASQFAALEPATHNLNNMEIRPAPAYVHARTKVEPNGTHTDLNDHNDVRNQVRGGNYDALHYVDFTGDGFIEVTIPALSDHRRVKKNTIPAYSLLAAPDFFPSAGQRELFEMVPQSFWGVVPQPLCDTRLPANLQAPKNRFNAADKTITSIVPVYGAVSVAPVRPLSTDVVRHSSLPDDAAGVIAPGWDVSTDVDKNNIHHLAAYGLGSPFPEDAKLCAALSTFWPAVAPDAARAMSSHTGNQRLLGTVAPLSDAEIGQQLPTIPWDGVTGPRLVEFNGQTFVEFESFLHVDYIQTALAGRFTSRFTGRVTAEMYAQRMNALHAIYARLKVDRNNVLILSFRHVANDDEELQRAQTDAATLFRNEVYRVSLLRAGDTLEEKHPSNHRKKLLPASVRFLFFVEPDSKTILHRRSDQTLWRKLP